MESGSDAAVALGLSAGGETDKVEEEDEQRAPSATSPCVERFAPRVILREPEEASLNATVVQFSRMPWPLANLATAASVLW